MKNIRFYLEYNSIKEKRKATRKNLGSHTGNCLAIPLENGRPLYIPCSINMEAFGAVFFTENADCGSTSVSMDYLHENCKRISEEQAREIHPALFAYLES